MGRWAERWTREVNILWWKNKVEDMRDDWTTSHLPSLPLSIRSGRRIHPAHLSFCSRLPSGQSSVRVFANTRALLVRSGVGCLRNVLR